MRHSEFSNRLELATPFQESLDQVSNELKLEIWNEVILKFAAYGQRGRLINELFIKAFACFFEISLEQVRHLLYLRFTNRFRERFFELKGLRFYDLLNYLSQKTEDKELIKVEQESCTFAKAVNLILESKGAPCRFLDSFALTSIIDEVELESVNDAAQTLYEKTVNLPMKKASNALFAEDAEDCCSNVYKAIEALVKTKVGVIKGDFSNLINKLKLDPALRSSIASSWGFVSSRARHGQPEGNYKPPTLEEAKFILVLGSALINLINTLEV
jgi:hypothetical protein